MSQLILPRRSLIVGAAAFAADRALGQVARPGGGLAPGFKSGFKFLNSTTLWTPAQLGTSAVAWWDATDAAAISVVSGAVSQINDKSGNGRPMTQATAGSRFAYLATGGPLSQPMMQGTGKSMSASVAAGSFSGGLVFISAWQKIGATTQYNAAPLTRTNGNTASPLDSYNALRYVGNANAVTSPDDLGSSSKFTAFNIFQQTVLSNGGYIERTNGTQTTSSNGPYQDTSTVVSLATRADGVTTANMNFLEAVCLQTATQSVLYKLEGYLAWRQYGSGSLLPAGHPYVSRAPYVSDP